MPETTEKYHRIPVRSKSVCQKDSIRTIKVTKGIKALICKKKDGGKSTIVTYLFDVKKFTMKEARSWVKKHSTKSFKITTEGEMLMAEKNKTFVTGQMVLKDIKPEEVDAIADLSAEGSRRYFISAEMVHEGQNGNGDIFTKDELISGYKSAKFNLIDWEHNWNQLIGSTTDSDLKAAENGKPVALVVEGVLWRETPAMIKDNRDATIRKRYKDGTLSVSMEVYFSRAICAVCGFSTEDMMEFEKHRATHVEYLNKGQKPGRILVGVEFCGMGIVDTPADPIADILTLDDTALAAANLKKEGNKNKTWVITPPEDGSKYYQITVCNFSEKPEPGKKPVQAKKIVEPKSKPNTRKDKGGRMFKFEDKEYSTLDEVVKAFKDGWFTISIGDNSTYVEKRGKLEDLSEKFQKALIDFISNMEEASLVKEEVKKLLGNEIGDLTAKLEASTEEIKKAKEDLADVKKEVDARSKELAQAREKLAEANKGLAEFGEKLSKFEVDLKKKQDDEKVDKALAQFKEAEIELGKDALVKVKAFLTKHIHDEDAVNSYVEDAISFYKSLKVTASSIKNSGLSPSGDPASSDGLTHLEKVEKKYKKKENSEEE